MLWALVVDILASWTRLFLALAVSILFSLIFGIAAAKSRRLEKIIIPSIDILQTIPILGFFPVVIYLIVSAFPNQFGVNVAVIFLIFTSMVWNITFGVYEGVKAIPNELIEMAKLHRFSWYRRIREIYIPASMPRIAYQTSISWSVGLFYLVTSEIFSTGSSAFAVKSGIGIAISSLAATGSSGYIIALGFFVAAVILTRIVFLTPFSIYGEKFSFKEEPNSQENAVLRFYRAIFNKIKRFDIGSLRMSYTPPKPNTFFGKMLKESEMKKKRDARRPKKSNFGTILAVAISIAATFVFLTYGLAQYTPEVLVALAYSFARVWGVYMLAAAISVPLGIYIALSKTLYEPVVSILQTVSAIPATIILPAMVTILYLLPFGGELTALSVIFLATIWYVLFSTIAGVRTIPNSLIEMKKMLRLDEFTAFKQIYVPAMLPSFITGSITAIGGAWNALIVAEFFTVQSGSKSIVLTQVGHGIGKLIDKAVFSGNLPLTGFAVGAMVVMVVIINRLFWQKVYDKASHYAVGS